MPTEDVSDRLVSALSHLDAVADEVTPDEALQAIDEATLEVFWRTGHRSTLGPRHCGNGSTRISRDRPPRLRIPTWMRSVRAGDREHDQVVAR
jgi:hypothetical protein